MTWVAPVNGRTSMGSWGVITYPLQVELFHPTYPPGSAAHSAGSDDEASVPVFFSMKTWGLFILQEV